MKNTFNENPNVKISVEINDDYAKYLAPETKEKINMAQNMFYDIVNHVVCYADPNNNLPIEKVLAEQDDKSKNNLAALVIRGYSKDYKNEAIESKINGKYMLFNRDDCVRALYNDAFIDENVRYAIGVIYAKKLVGKLAMSNEEKVLTARCKAIVDLVNHACEMYKYNNTMLQAFSMMNLLKNVDDIAAVVFTNTLISLVKDDFDENEDFAMLSAIDSIQNVLTKKISELSKVKLKVDGNSKIAYNPNSCLHYNTSAPVEKEDDDDEEFL